MNILGIETSSREGSIAIINKNGLVYEHFLPPCEFKTERLSNYIKNSLNELKLPLKKLNGISVCIGPGSYTSLRIGLITAKTIAQILNIPVFGFSTLDVIACGNVPLDGTLLVTTHARQNIVNLALFGLSSQSVFRLTEDFTLNQDILIKNLCYVKGNLFLSGEKSPFIFNKVKKKNKNCVLLSPIHHRPKASTLTFLALQKFNKKDLPLPSSLNINYSFAPHAIMSNKIRCLSLE